ncbi:MAG: hypothetical protein PHW60_05725 [Kiritimatiellae bacterium]|nr:hypothetical protein [Kiritimatiellia bacterium]
MPTGTYSVTLPTVRGYATPTTLTTNITGASPLVNTLALNYLAYSNSLAVTVSGIASGSNCAWTLTGPADFTNAVSFGTTFTNSFTVTGIPTGLYTITFPAVVGYTAPATASTNITGASPAINSLTGLYASVIWGTNTSTNTPATNFPAYTNAITLMVDTNGHFMTPSAAKIIAANGLLTNGAVGPQGPAGPAGAQGSQGLPGSNGLDGAVGPQGPAGPAGSNGVDGVQGPQGPAGTNGADGATGPQGPPGTNGAAGAVGPQGPPGSNGVDGAQGPPGSNGVDGAIGPAGPAGSNGVDGAVGPQGPAGTNGADGAQGPPGSNGVDGATGPAGPAGSNGVDGAVGPQGPPGTNGTDGAQGPPGTNGTDGQAATIAIAWTSNGVPGSAASVANLGTENAAVFGFVIPAGSNGIQGIQGPAGSNGADGAVGPQGPAGPNGTNGADGAVGPQGPAGSNGVDGAQGPPGSNGVDGAVGPQGPAGSVTNQIMAVNGVLYTITNTPAAGNVLKFDPSTSNAWFALDNSEGTNNVQKSGDIMTGPLTNNAGIYGNGIGITNMPAGIWDTAPSYFTNWPSWTNNMGTNAFGYIVYLSTNGIWQMADADWQYGGWDPIYNMLGLVMNTNALNGVLRKGVFVYPGGILSTMGVFSLKIGQPVYLSYDLYNAGMITQTKSTQSDKFQRFLGYALTTNTIYFDPCGTPFNPPPPLNPE